jgi:GTPase SAR1 family protein
MLTGSDSAVRIVLFGMPEAGKSSLLGALAQAAPAEEAVLRGKLIDRTHGLVELQRRLYEDRPRETLDEIEPYAIALEPPTTKDGQAGKAAEAVLVDCDGRAANKLLDHKEGLTSELSDGALAQAVVGADALMLVIDIAAEPARVQFDFGQFARFLRALEANRGQRAEVGGLPVFLVLTKCDLLAKLTDTTAHWLERIEERKRVVRQRFEEFLAQQAAREQMPFGKIDLHVWATAVKRPALADAPARPNEPYGVAELFRQSIDSALNFRQRTAVATRRLGWVVGILAGMVGLMAALAFFFLAAQAETEMGRFEHDLRSYHGAHSDNVAERLREPAGKTVAELQTFRDDPLFSKMPQELQKQTLDQLREAEAYDKYAKQWQAAVKAAHLPEAPRLARSEAELEGFHGLLEQYPVPEEYQTAWQDTDLVRRQRRWKNEIEVMQSEVKAALKAIDELQEIDAKIKDRKKFTGDQLDQFLEELKIKDKTLPYRTDNHLPIRNSRVTYADIALFDTVAVQLARYEKIRQYHKLNMLP